jgi:hypothetical protein
MCELYKLLTPGCYVTFLNSVYEVLYSQTLIQHRSICCHPPTALMKALKEKFRREMPALLAAI